MSLTREDLQAINDLMQQSLETERENTRQMMQQMIRQSEERIITRMDKNDKFLEDCINEAAKDMQLSIKRHEKEWHSA